tara:strand:+ start:933 stop:1127 length:195 start_codon:yes stop_codon:yes gene_type:complete
MLLLPDRALCLHPFEICVRKSPYLLGKPDLIESLTMAKPNPYFVGEFGRVVAPAFSVRQHGSIR